ncbi:RNA polymerase sigma factor [Sediminibacterium soli]|uniref:RNA polymerase sigma factor n=1 Tax=Sediminibacterium soli TaxID=2698829 RepID=UPI0013794FB1|nr:sigma-70 family RNA polymerase sigma factor [Sediminibacterium soli]NCI47749.1 sigma-70 family RNA polymerase sigma factor [Sediminibacterium soli]
MELSKKYDEDELVLRLRNRSRSVFSYLYEHYAGALRAVILNIVTDEELANDVLQEVFVKIWRQIDSYDQSRGRLFTWMLNIARNASIDMVRSRSFQNSRKNQELTDQAGGINEMRTDQIGLRKLVSGLREEYRMLVELAYFQGYTQDEIAKALSIPIGTVKTRLRAALIQLRDIVR